MIAPFGMVPPRSRLLVVLTLLMAQTALADLGGYVDFSGNRTDSEGIRRESLRQEYNLAWSRQLTPYLGLRSGLRYYKFDQDVDLSVATFQEEFQPSVDLFWHHPLFAFSTSARRRRAEATALAGNITTETFLANLRTQDQRYPLLGVRYEWQHLFDTVAGFDRDVNDERLQATADYNTGTDSWHYSFVHRVSENVVSDLESTRREHQIRWSHVEPNRVGDRLALQFNYSFNYSEQTDRLVSGDEILERVPVAAGMYAEDEIPGLGALEAVAGLNDGDTATPTIPAIAIGGAAAGRNIGLDLGFARPLVALYVSTDRLSGVQPGWRLYHSDDNLNWTEASFIGPVVFNAALSRYEFSFQALTHRYLKVVKDGANEILDVLVTEIEALQAVPVLDAQRRLGRAHRADARLAFEFNDDLGTSLDASAGLDERAGPLGDRSNADYSWRAWWQMSPSIQHQWRWTQSFEQFAAGDDQRDDVVAYTMLYEPLETVSTAVGALSRWNYLAGRLDQDQRNLFIDLGGRPVPRLNASLGGTWSRIENRASAVTSDVAAMRSALDGRVTGWLDLSLALVLPRGYQPTRVTTR